MNRFPKQDTTHELNAEIPYSSPGAPNHDLQNEPVLSKSPPQTLFSRCTAPPFVDKAAQAGGGGAFEDIVRIGERIIDFQFRIVIDRLERTDRLIRLGIATLAGMFAVLGLLITQGAGIDMVGVLGIGTSILLVVLTIYSLARLNAGLHQHQLIRLGPDLRDLYNHVSTYGPGRGGYAQDLAKHMCREIEDNLKTIRYISARQAHAVLLYGWG